MKTTKIIRIQAREKTRENAYVTAQVLKVFLREVGTEAIEYTVLNRIDGYQTDALQTFVLILEGESLEAFIKEWLGTVLWLGKVVVAGIKKACRLQVDIAVIDTGLLQEIGVRDLSFQYVRSRGSGGQHVNKVSTAVRACYPPFGLSVKVDESRSQAHNKRLALERLREKIRRYQLDVLIEKAENFQAPRNIFTGQAVKILRGACFAKNTKQKSYKKKRNQLKKELRQWKI